MNGTHRRWGWMVQRASVAAALIASLCAVRVEAQGSAGAAKAFAQAQAAELAGQPEEAARFYELAHLLAPTAEALRSAARTRFEAGQRALAASHADAVLRLYPSDTKSRTIAQNILDATAAQLVSVSVRCSVPCQMDVDGGATPAPASQEHVLYMEPGEHRLTATFDGEGTATQVVSGEAGTRVSRSFEPPPRTQAPPVSFAPAEGAEPALGGAPSSTQADESERRKLPRAWFFVSAGAAVALAGTAVWSGLDVLDAHDEYKRRPTDARFDAGQKLERRTNILIGASAAVAASAVVMAFFTQWSGDEEPPAEQRASLQVGVTSQGSSLTFMQRF